MAFFLKFDLTQFTIIVQVIEWPNSLAGKPKWRYCIGWIWYKLRITQQAGTESSSVKNVFFLRIGRVLDRTGSAAKRSCSVEKGSTLAKLCVLLCPFSLLHGNMIAFFLILNELTVKHIQWSGKLRYSAEWLNILGGTPVLNLFLASEHLNSSKDEPVLIFDKMSWKKINALARINFLSRTVQSMFTIRRQGGKKENLFYRTSHSGCLFCHKLQPIPIFTWAFHH